MQVTSKTLGWAGGSVLLFLVACAASRASGVMRTPASRVVAAKCGACHPLPQARSLDSARFNEVLAAHARRVRLSPEEKSAVRAHLSRDGTGNAQVHDHRRDTGAGW